MPSIDITNLKVLSFLNESYEKEAHIRSNWNTKNQAVILKSTALNREFKNIYDYDVTKNIMTVGMAAITREHATGARYRFTKMSRDGKIPEGKAKAKGHSILDIGLGTIDEDPRLDRPDSSLEPAPIMRPVDEKVTSIIYHPKVDGNGRREYLKEREKSSPEKRFYFAECVNWDYGWRMKDSQLKQVPRRGRSCILTDASRNNRGGAHRPDPTHYQSADIPTVAKCFL